VVFEAGKLKDLLLTPVQQRRLTGIVVKHDSEWKKTRAADFNQTCGVFRANGKEEIAKRIEKRIADLSIKLEVDGFNTDKQAYYLHPLGMIGWLAVSVGEFDWFETPLVKLILSKESKGSFNAYNITNKHGKPRESHFTPTAQYHISKMTITEIRNAQKTRIGPEGLHLFAIGVVQIIPNTLEQFLSWLSKYKSINRDIQLFDEEFQRLMPMFFWEEKVSKVASFFRGKIGVDKAAYAISREWASAGVPKGEPTKTGRVSDGGLETYYDDKPGNKAHYSADITIKALNDTKEMINAAGGYDAVREISLSKIRG
jgi:rhs element vgr protein